MITNHQLILPYAAPYFAYVAIAGIPTAYLPHEFSYILRLIAVPLILCWTWRWYCPLRGPYSPLASILFGAGAGLIGLIIWIALLAPFVSPGDSTHPWSFNAFLLRMLSAGLLVPVFEELMMRGFVFRLALQWDRSRKNNEKYPFHIALDERSINDVEPGKWSWSAVILSTVVFASGHSMQEWPAAVAYGLFMALLWIFRKDLITCIAAHAVTNIALAFYVFSTGKWHYW